MRTRLSNLGTECRSIEVRDMKVLTWIGFNILCWIRINGGALGVDDLDIFNCQLASSVSCLESHAQLKIISI